MQRDRCSATPRRAALARGPLCNTWSFRRLELLRVDLRVDANAIERGFFDGLPTDRAPDAERPFRAVHIAKISVVQAVLDRTRLTGRGLLPHQHHRQMRVLLYDETRGKVSRAGDVQHVGLSLRGFADAPVLERQGIARK